ncbi:MAG: pyridine nucleotide-disulfide oxidoreductase, partial [Clostridia bacterium]|nr:pyridine nucleotide-disulfide oxidoreductase [Clostridia bacterium]
SVYFRVSDVFRDKKVTVRSGDTIIYQKKHLKLAPGEMECVKLTADKLHGANELVFGLED